MMMLKMVVVTMWLKRIGVEGSGVREGGGVVGGVVVVGIVVGIVLDRAGCVGNVIGLML